MKLNMRYIIKAMVYAGLALGSFAVSYAATTTPPAGSLGSVASNVSASFPALGNLLTAFSYIVGIIFTVISFFKFKQSKDAGPGQHPIHNAVALLAIGIAMITLPSVIGMGASTLFKNAQTFGTQGGGCDQAGSINNCLGTGTQ